jgi:hypothetical protein
MTDTVKALAADLYRSALADIDLTHEQRDALLDAADILTGGPTPGPLEAALSRRRTNRHLKGLMPARLELVVAPDYSPAEWDAMWGEHRPVYRHPGGTQ